MLNRKDPVADAVAEILDEGMQGTSYVAFHKDTKKIDFVGNKKARDKWHQDHKDTHHVGMTIGAKVGDMFGRYNEETETHPDDKKDEKEDKKLIKKMVKSDCLKNESFQQKLDELSDKALKGYLAKKTTNPALSTKKDEKNVAKAERKLADMHKEEVEQDDDLIVEEYENEQQELTERTSTAYHFTHTPGDEESEKKLSDLKAKVKGSGYRVHLKGRIGKDNPHAAEYHKGGSRSGSRHTQTTILKKHAQRFDVYVHAKDSRKAAEANRKAGLPWHHQPSFKEEVEDLDEAASKFKEGDRITKTMGVRMHGHVIKQFDRGQSTDGTYGSGSSPKRGEVPVKWDDGSKGYAHHSHIALHKEEVEQVNELSHEKLEAYKTAAHKKSIEAYKSGHFKKGDKRSFGYMKAVEKQHRNDEEVQLTAEETEELLGEREIESYNTWGAGAANQAKALAKHYTKKTGELWTHFKHPRGENNMHVVMPHKHLPDVEKSFHKEEVVLEGHTDHEAMAKELVKMHGKDVTRKHAEAMKSDSDSPHLIDTDEIMHHVDKMKKMGDVHEDFAKKGTPQVDGLGDDEAVRKECAVKMVRDKMKSIKKEEIDFESLLEDAEINEVITKATSAGEVIKDFQKSKNPKFAGKSKEKRREMAIAAYMHKQNEETTTEAVDKDAVWKAAKAKVDADETKKMQNKKLHVNKIGGFFARAGQARAIDKAYGMKESTEDAYTLGMGHFDREWRKEKIAHPTNPHPKGSNEHHKWNNDYERGKKDRERELGEDYGNQAK